MRSVSQILVVTMHHTPASNLAEFSDGDKHAGMVAAPYEIIRAAAAAQVTPGWTGQ
jgi:hypothetical protein